MYPGREVATKWIQYRHCRPLVQQAYAATCVSPPNPQRAARCNMETCTADATTRCRRSQRGAGHTRSSGRSREQHRVGQDLQHPAAPGDLYTKIITTDENSRLYGFIPVMASSSPYQIGALNAESFCERVLRCAGHILTDGNTLLADAKLEKLVILRMNRKFMEFMRKHYKHVVKDKLTRQFGMSIVDDTAE